MAPTDQDDASATSSASGNDGLKEHTSAFDRVRSVALSLSEPRSGSWIADEALVAENTARRHLERLAELHVLTTDATGNAVTYYPDPVYVRTRDLRELVAEYDRDELTELAAELTADIESWQDEYDVASLDELRSTAAAEDTSADETMGRHRTASDRDLTKYRLSHRGRTLAVRRVQRHATSDSMTPPLGPFFFRDAIAVTDDGNSDDRGQERHRILRDCNGNSNAIQQYSV